MEYEGTTQKVIGCAYTVFNTKVIVELKSVQRLVKSHHVQLVNYLVATGLPVGLLINFGETGVEVRRKIRQLPSASGIVFHDPHPANPVILSQSESATSRSTACPDIQQR